MPLAPSRWPADRTRIYPTRTVTWAVEDPQGALLWYASARETNPEGPPLALSQRLALALSQWATPAP